MNNKIFIACIIVHYGCQEISTDNAIATVKKFNISSSLAHLKLFVVDNSQNFSFSQDHVQNITIIKPDTNLGFGKAINLACQSLSGESYAYILLLNNDAELNISDFEVFISRVLLCNPQPLLSSGKSISYNSNRGYYLGSRLGFLGLRCSVLKPGTYTNQEPIWLSGACLLINPSVFSHLPLLFDPDFFMYWEDAKLSWDCLKHGSIYLVDIPICTHTPGHSTKSNVGLRYRYHLASQLLFYKKIFHPLRRLAYSSFLILKYIIIYVLFFLRVK